MFKKLIFAAAFVLVGFVSADQCQNKCDASLTKCKKTQQGFIGRCTRIHKSCSAKCDKDNFEEFKVENEEFDVKDEEEEFEVEDESEFGVSAILNKCMRDCNSLEKQCRNDDRASAFPGKCDIVKNKCRKTCEETFKKPDVEDEQDMVVSEFADMVVFDENGEVDPATKKKAVCLFKCKIKLATCKNSSLTKIFPKRCEKGYKRCQDKCENLQNEKKPEEKTNNN